MELVRQPFGDANAAALDGRIRDAKTTLALLPAASRGVSGVG